MIRAVFRWTALAVSAILFLLPFYLLLRNGLASRAEITAPDWTLWPKQIRWENFTKLFDQQDVPFARSILNSVIVAVLQTVGLLVVCSLAGYGLARVPYRYSKPVFYAVLATLMIPTSVTFVPSFVVVSTLGWLSDFRGLVIPGLFSAFSVFLFRQYFLDFPKELEDAGRVDGLSRWGVF
ncbi:carbohydrate ABC transporter permease, partial [Amycolatopsis silviterrae]